MVQLHSIEIEKTNLLPQKVCHASPLTLTVRSCRTFFGSQDKTHQEKETH